MISKAESDGIGSRGAPGRAAEAILRAVFGGDRWLACAFAVLAAIAIAPIWAVRFLPLLDLPNHLGAIAIWHRLGDPSWGFDRFYTKSLLPAPYWGYYLPVHLLAYLVPIELANRLYLTAYAVALPASAAVFARRFGRSPWLCVLAFPLVWSYDLGWGFISFCAGLPVLLLGLAVLDAYLEEGGAGRLALVAAAGLGAYFMHILPWMLLGACAVVMLLFALGRPRRVVLAGAALSLSVGAAYLNYRMERAEATRALLKPGPLGWEAGYEEPAGVLRDLHERILMGPVDGMGWVLLGLGLSFLLVVATAPPREATGRARAPSRVPELLFFVAAASYVFMPLRIVKPLDWWNVNARFAAVAALAAVALPHGAIRGARRLVLAPAAIAFAVYVGALLRECRAFDASARDFARLMAKVPRGSSTLFMSAEGNPHPSLRGGLVYYEFAGYAQVLAGGYNPYAFKANFPFRARTDVLLPPAPSWSTRWGDYSQQFHGSRYDYLLTYQEARDGQVLRGFGERVPLVGREGGWRLYRTRDIK